MPGTRSRRLGDPTFGGPGFPVLERARKTIARYGMFEPGDKVVVALSGGPDSTCLFDVLSRLRERLDLDLVVAHVDHGLGDRSADIAARVSTAVASAGLEAHVVRAPDLEGPNLQARARAFRYGFFDMVAQREQATRVATGHTLDDRVETTIARLIHGAGTTGLAGIPPVDPPRVRPLIDVRRSESRAYCVECGLDFDDDAANEDLRFDRAAIRKLVMAAIEERWGEGAIRAMATSAERLREDSDALARLAARVYGDIATYEDGVTRIPRSALVAMPGALRRRILERAVGRVRDRSAGIDEVLDALDEDFKAVSSFAIASGVAVTVTDAEVTIEGPSGDDT